MCGIAGVAGKPLKDADRTIANACWDLRHRGPDGQGQSTITLGQNEVAFGHTRLAILDLHDRGLQPMKSPDGRFSIVFNGEIYNYPELRSELEHLGHQFCTATDTEVLIAAWTQWRADALSRLTGMFAFAILDTHDETVTLARDAFGIKPLYSTVENERLYFASDVQSIARMRPLDRGLNDLTTVAFLVHGRYDHGTETFLEGIERLAAGHLQIFNLATCRLGPQIRWWWPNIQERDDITFSEATEALREMLLSNVRLHMRSDVPIGAALSGGIDSSAIVSLMRRVEPDVPIHTFTFVPSDARIDESRWADIVNDRTGSVSHRVSVRDADLLHDLDDLVIAQGEPFSSTSIYAQYAVYRAFRQASIPVSLDGQGADELLAGYHGYPTEIVRSMVERGHSVQARFFLARWSRLPGRTPQAARKIWSRERLRGQHGAGVAKSKSLPGWLHPRLSGLQFRLQASVEVPREAPLGRALSLKLRDEITNTRLQTLLRHGDRNSMRWSVESRVPFLTTALAEFTLRLPEAFLVGPNGTTKRLLRAAISDILPAAVRDRKDKIGFETAESNLIQELVDRPSLWVPGLAESGLFRSAEAIGDLIQREVSTGKTGRLWRLMSLGRWLQLR